MLHLSQGLNRWYIFIRKQFSNISKEHPSGHYKGDSSSRTFLLLSDEKITVPICLQNDYFRKVNILSQLCSRLSGQFCFVFWKEVLLAVLVINALRRQKYQKSFESEI